QLGLAEAAAGEALGEGRVTGGVPDALDTEHPAIEVRADAHLRRAGDGGAVDDGVRGSLDGVASQQVLPGDHPDHSAGARDLSRLLVREIALDRGEAAEPGVRRED